MNSDRDSAADPLPGSGEPREDGAGEVARLARSFEIWSEWKRVPEPQRPPMAAVLARHPELRDLLEPILTDEAEPPSSHPGADTATDADAERPTRIGPYRIVEHIGSGGMGDVYKARQSAPIERLVAVKALRRGMNSAEILGRFDLERQALARLEHPAIARIYDGGVAADGRPYFAMEYVDGAAITEFCDREQLSIRERVRLFLAVLQGIAHAHQRGIIHRDLKPSNLLVSRQSDGAVEVKIIDFGIAKAVDEAARDTARLGHTRSGQVIGTPEYMSPEQAEGNADLDTRTDVYSAGIVLFRLLVGDVPFPDEDRRSTSDLLAAVRTREVPRPSLRTESREVRGDLDWIVLRAVALERDRRYGTIEAFAADLENHLAGREITAAPPSRRYRITKFVRRHKAAVLATAAIGLVLAVSLAVSLGLLVEAHTARVEAERRSRQAETVTGFLVALFRRSDPDEALGASTPVGVFLDEAAVRIDDELLGEPEVRARLALALGRVFGYLGAFDRAEERLASAIDAFRAAGQSDDPGAIRAELALAIAWENRGRIADALARLQAVEQRLHETIARSMAEDRRKLDQLLAQTTIDRGRLLAELGDVAGGEAAITEGLNRLDDASATPARRATVRMALSRTESRRGNHGRALDHVRDAIATLRRSHPAGSRREAVALAMASETLRRTGELDQAMELGTQAVDLAARILPPTHSIVARCRLALGNACKDRGRRTEARAHYRAAIDAYDPLLPYGHQVSARAWNDLGVLELEAGRHPAAIAALERALAAYDRDVVLRESIHRAIALANLANALERAGRGSLERAHEQANESVELAARLEDDAALVGALSARSSTRARLGRMAEAHADLDRAVAVLEQRPTTERQLAWLRIQQALLDCMAGDGSAAQQRAERALAILDGTTHWWTAVAEDLLGWSLSLQGRHDAALPHLEDSVARFRALAPSGAMFAAYAYERLAIALYRRSPARAADLFAAAVAVRETMLDALAPQLLQTRENEAAARLAAGEHELAAVLASRAADDRRRAAQATGNGAESRPKRQLLARSLLFAAQAHTKTGSFQTARELAQEAVTLATELFGKAARPTARARLELGVAALETGDPTLAINELTAARSILGNTLASNAPELQRIEQALAKARAGAQPPETDR
ncbi:MAG: serine/threonine-protein kinase [bacterium]|nr:serine/threonine-protein kinase [bacterium]